MDRAPSSSPLHLTLRFLGEIAAGNVRSIGGVLASVAASHAAFRLSLGALGGFPNLNRPRVVYVEIGEGRAEVESLARAIDVGLGGIGLPRTGRPFVPHVTLWRVRSPRDLERVRRLSGVGSLASELALTVEEILLKSSELRLEGAHHEVVGRWPLRRASEPAEVAPGMGSPSPGGAGPLRHD